MLNQRPNVAHESPKTPPLSYKSGSATATAHVKLNISNILTLEPLQIKITENEESRAPTNDECEVLLKKLFEVYKQQKQQVAKIVALKK